MTPEDSAGSAHSEGSAGSESVDACLLKNALRRSILAARDAIPAEDRARHSRDVCDRASCLPELAGAGTLMLFAAFRTEVDTAPLIAWALGEGKTVCLPRVLGPRHMAAFRIVDVKVDLVPGAWGIPEPRTTQEEVPPGVVDAVVVPGAVFDVEGRRCGYGGGFYDNYLPLTRPGVPWVALAFDAQVVDMLPCEPHDLAVGTIVTETRVIRTG